ncbi:hypothetical protein Kpho02_59830 [Kitasatospora phosalacinea]|uniref:Uncharacterized protein n=1 Tax=Kitasatospora phosalacinea TaxID=2065 RepID=A0A9W6V615_9ACTN|nr:hypothetical protein [Kitasatospora phosalacinea]GLW73685.1 hypothetical protein Kpho02_59830 [Kitasatospora phosalacinea]
MTTPDDRARLRYTARTPEEFAAYTAGLVRHLGDLRTSLALLGQETSQALRETSVAGDGRFDARLRALPVERQLAKTIRSLESAAKSLERSALRRIAHDSRVAALPAQRAAKALEKANKKPSKSAPVNQNSASTPGPAESSYTEPRNIFDLKRPA